MAAPRGETPSLAERYARLAAETPTRRGVDLTLRTLDVLLASLFLLVTLPVWALIAVVSVLSTGLPVLYRGDRVGRGGRVFHMLKFRTLRAGAEDRLGPYLGADLVEGHRRALGERAIVRRRGQSRS